MNEFPVSPRDSFPNLPGKRVLLLFPHVINPGGALFYTLHLAEQLREAGAKVSILTLRTSQESINVPTGIDVISLNGPLTSNLSYWLRYSYWQGRINRAILEWHPDLLIPQVFPSNWWGWLYKRKHRKTKLAWVCHEPSAFIHSSPWINALKPWWKSLIARTLRPCLAKVDISLAQYSDRTIANSDFTAESIKRVYGSVPDATARPGITYCAIDNQDCPGKSSVMTVARLSKFKRVDFLIDVFAEIHRQRPELTFYIVGKGEEEAILRKKVDRLELGSHVVFSGAVEDHALTELYKCSLLYLHGSVDEPFGMAPLEAIACGTPVVAHNSGGPKEFITDECGRLIDSLDTKVWAEKISVYLDTILADKDMRNRVKKSAELFDWRVTLLPAMETLNDLLAD